MKTFTWYTPETGSTVIIFAENHEEACAKLRQAYPQNETAEYLIAERVPRMEELPDLILIYGEYERRYYCDLHQA